MAEIIIQQLKKSYSKGTPVLDGIDLTIRQGELFFLLGPSGCGKSTLLRILAGLVTPDSGTITFDGKDILPLPPEKRRAAMVFQNYALWPNMNVFENVAFGLRMAGTPKQEITPKVEEALSCVHLEGYEKRAIPQLSGGQQQRVALARALAVNPALLLLDEPLSNLDANLRDTMRHEIRRICTERKLTALYVTHDRREALSMADRAGVMNHGKLTQIGTPDEIYNHPADAFTARFLGDVNHIPAGGIRPERLHIHPEAAPERLEAVLTGRSFYGDNCEWEFQLAANSQVVIVREQGAPAREIGKHYFLSWEKEFLIPAPDECCHD